MEEYKPQIDPGKEAKKWANAGLPSISAGFARYAGFSEQEALEVEIAAHERASERTKRLGELYDGTELKLRGLSSRDLRSLSGEDHSLRLATSVAITETMGDLGLLIRKQQELREEEQRGNTALAAFLREKLKQAKKPTVTS